LKKLYHNNCMEGSGTSPHVYTFIYNISFPSRMCMALILKLRVTSRTLYYQKKSIKLFLFHVSLYFAYIMNGLPNYIQGLVSIPVVPNKLLTTIIEGWNSLTEAYNTIGTRKILWCISGMHPWFAFQAILLMQIRRTQTVKKILNEGICEYSSNMHHWVVCQHSFAIDADLEVPTTKKLHWQLPNVYWHRWFMINYSGPK
jgi:hypothetical protein